MNQLDAALTEHGARTTVQPPSLTESPTVTPITAPEARPGSSLAADRAAPFLPALLLLFVGSGCSALVYEIVWFQLLQLVIGSSAVSLGVLLGTFMGGMCLGSLLLPRLISARHHPLRVYAFLELGIAALGVALLFGMPLIGELYTSNVGYGLSGVLLRGVICGVCLLPPTMLMGATLPAIARWVESTPEGVSRLGFFYGANIAGAVFGCLLAGFYLLRLYDTAIATYVAVGVNVTVAAVALGIATRAPYRSPEPAPVAVPTKHPRGDWVVYLVIALSGMGALGAEVIWTRQLSLLMGATVYTFSIILAVFLTGLGIGSGIGAYLSGRVRRPAVALGVCQLLLAGAVVWSAWMLAESLPYWPIDVALASSPWLNFQLDVVRCLWAILPAALLWGASFPLALAAVATRGQDPGRLVGGVYAANTVGAIVGALGFSLAAVAWLGTQTAQQVLIGLAGIGAVLMFAAATRGIRVSRAIAVVTALVLAAWLTRTVPAAPQGLIAYGRNLPLSTLGDVLYVGEGMNASVAVTEDLFDKSRYFHVSGKVVASSLPEDMRLQRMLGHLPAMTHPAPKSVLVVGCGAGVTAGSFIPYPSIERIVICEIEPLIPPAAREYFGYENHYVLDDPRVEVITDDARHYIVTTNETFDIITSDPIHPWVKGAAALYSLEYFELCKKRLNPGGVVTQWVPLYESTPEAVRSELATFFQAFPHGTVWGNDINGQGYDIVLLGQNDPSTFNLWEWEDRLSTQDHLHAWLSMEEVGFPTPADLLSTYAGRAADLKEWLRDAELNRDRNLRLQYLAGMGLNAYHAAGIYDEMLEYRRFPRELFRNADELKPRFAPAADENP